MAGRHLIGMHEVILDGTDEFVVKGVARPIIISIARRNPADSGKGFSMQVDGEVFHVATSARVDLERVVKSNLVDGDVRVSLSGPEVKDSSPKCPEIDDRGHTCGLPANHNFDHVFPPSEEELPPAASTEPEPVAQPSLSEELGL